MIKKINLHVIFMRFIGNAFPIENKELPHMTTTKSKGHERRYILVVPRIQLFSFEVEADSPEDACKRLWQRLQSESDPSLPKDAEVGLSKWNAPEAGDEWWVFGDDLRLPIETDQTASAWDGKRILSIKLA